MNHEQADALLKRILDFPFEEASVQICAASAIDADSPPIFEKLQISTDVASEFKQMVARGIRKLRKDSEAGDCILRRYEAGALNKKEEVEYYDVANDQDILEQINPFFDIGGLEVFQNSDEFVSNLKFYGLVFHANNETIVAIRSFGPAKELSRSSFISVTLFDSVFNKITEPTFLFDNKYDCFLFGSALFIFNKNNFHQMFQYYERVRTAGENALNAISEKIPIKHIDELRSMCRANVHMLSKLKNIAAKNYIPTLTLGDIRKVINSFHLPVQIVESEGTEQLVFDPTNKDKWLLLKILDDDYLDSEMTSNQYEANSKRSLQ